ncbi:MarR family transcriptional regulator [Dissulfurimicrobium hydrothermale]|uniref:MarR family transcriptional regulator n=1 Tax=Dissulfurimicrobium hydrothermale TaxID=1750598 RepID=UPI001EDAC2E3|nr:MarR family transcriptional regulator [Dissulfurimicrobium hydrothermale]UKL13005.1 MarR family transcriptional regulator [Dissulfurimicrobium hydrothermale]
MERQSNRNIREVMRDEMYLKDKIAGLLHEGPKTIPELADALNLPSHEMVRIVMAMRRYGYIEEIPKNRRDDYFRYKFVGRMGQDHAKA